MALRPNVLPTEYMNNFNSGLMLDDQIWVETLRRERLLQEESIEEWSSPSEDLFFHLMRVGSSSDDSRFDQPGYTLTRAPRYSAALSFVRATLPVQLPVPLSIPDTTCSQQA